jgi:hypothetical protein
VADRPRKSRDGIACSRAGLAGKMRSHPKDPRSHFWQAEGCEVNFDEDLVNYSGFLGINKKLAIARSNHFNLLQNP